MRAGWQADISALHAGFWIGLLAGFLGGFLAAWMVRSVWGRLSGIIA